MSSLLLHRSRRRLLLPGWVALGFLLLLGCLLLRAHWRQVRPVNVLQLTMPRIEPNAAQLALYRRYGSFSETPYSAIYKSVAELDKLRPWHSIEFGGQPLRDFFGAQAIETAIRAINADSSHAGGVRVCFRRGTTYGDMVKVLDLMLITDQQKYWLDTRYQPSTLYAITKKELPRSQRPAPDFICGTKYYESTSLLPRDSFWRRWLATYWLPAWRLPLLLILGLGGLSAYRLNGLPSADSGTGYSCADLVVRDMRYPRGLPSPCNGRAAYIRNLKPL